MTAFPVFIGKIPPSVDDGLMNNLLLVCGSFSAWRRPRDPASHKLKSFGFADFSSATAAALAFRILNGVDLESLERSADANSTAGLKVQIEDAVKLRIDESGAQNAIDSATEEQAKARVLEIVVKYIQDKKEKSKSFAVLPINKANMLADTTGSGQEQISFLNAQMEKFSKNVEADFIKRVEAKRRKKKYEEEQQLKKKLLEDATTPAMRQRDEPDPSSNLPPKIRINIGPLSASGGTISSAAPSSATHVALRTSVVTPADADIEEEPSAKRKRLASHIEGDAHTGPVATADPGKLDKTKLEELEGFLSARIQLLLGEDEPSLVSFILMRTIKERAGPADLLADLKPILEEDAEKLVHPFWKKFVDLTA
eukprot:ANDGO_08162.mRNA.1 hypothetical protein SPRG_03986